MLKKSIYCIFLFVMILCNSCKERSVQDTESDSGASQVHINAIPSKFINVLPFQKDVITDLTNTLSESEKNSLDSIWRNFFYKTKFGVMTLVLDSGRVDKTEYHEFTRLIYKTSTSPEKSKTAYIILCPDLNKIEIFVGIELKDILTEKDTNAIIKNEVLALPQGNLYDIIKRLQMSIIQSITDNG